MPRKATLAEELAKRRKANLMAEMLWEISPEGRETMRPHEQIPYYPNEKYLKRGWAPEKMSRYSLENLIDAEKRAIKNKVLPASLANAMLPTAMVEGWDGGYGVVDATYGYPATPQRDETLKKMGIRVGPSNQDYRDFKDVDVLRHPRVGSWMPSGKWGDDAHNASRVMASLVPVIMAEKARLYGPDKMIERWNGRGNAWEDNGEDMQWADSKNHARKVEEAMRMLTHPANKRLYNEYLYRMLTE